jgi:hypothetical protein
MGHARATRARNAEQTRAAPGETGARGHEGSRAEILAVSERMQPFDLGVSCHAGIAERKEEPVRLRRDRPPPTVSRFGHPAPVNAASGVGAPRDRAPAARPPNALWSPDPGERGGMRGLRAARTSATEGAPGRAPLTAHCGCDVGLDDHSVAQPFLGRSSKGAQRRRPRLHVKVPHERTHLHRGLERLPSGHLH